MTTYYISPNGNDNNPGTETAPFETIQKGANSVSPGDTVIVKDGIYDTWGEEWTNGEKYGVFVRHGGTSESTRVTIKAENKHGAIIKLTRKGLLTIGFGHNTNVSFVTIKDFVISGVETGLHINNNNKHITFKGNEIYNVWDGVSVGNDCDYVIVDSNLIHDYGEVGKQHHGIYLRGVNAITQNNILYNYVGAGWHIHTGSYSMPPTGNHKIIGNTLIGHGTSDHGQICFYSCFLDKSIIQNNIFYDPGSYIIRPGASDHEIMYLQNNLISNNLVGYFSIPGDEPLTVIDTYNIINQDPKFISIVDKNFHLQVGSPAIGTGLTTNILYDFDGNIRKSPPCIGAYEYLNEYPSLINKLTITNMH